MISLGQRFLFTHRLIYENKNIHIYLTLELRIYTHIYIMKTSSPCESVHIYLVQGWYIYIPRSFLSTFYLLTPFDTYVKSKQNLVLLTYDWIILYRHVLDQTSWLFLFCSQNFLGDSLIVLKTIINFIHICRLHTTWNSSSFHFSDCEILFKYTCYRTFYRQMFTSWIKFFPPLLRLLLRVSPSSRCSQTFLF